MGVRNRRVPPHLPPEKFLRVQIPLHNGSMPIPEVEKAKEQLMEKDKETLAEQAAAFQYIMNSVNGEAQYWMQRLGEGFAAQDRMGERHMGKLVGINFKIEHFKVMESLESRERDQNLIYEQAGVSYLSPKALQTCQHVQMYEPKRKIRDDKPITNPEVSEEDLQQPPNQKTNQKGV